MVFARVRGFCVKQSRIWLPWDVVGTNTNSALHSCFHRAASVTYAGKRQALLHTGDKLEGMNTIKEQPEVSAGQYCIAHGLCVHDCLYTSEVIVGEVFSII